MRVIEVGSRGGPEVLSLAERPAPQPGPGQVAAAGVNYMDIYQREGAGGYRPPGGRPENCCSSPRSGFAGKTERTR